VLLKQLAALGFGIISSEKDLELIFDAAYFINISVYGKRAGCPYHKILIINCKVPHVLASVL
jgi:hypothetical protein